METDCTEYAGEGELDFGSMSPEDIEAWIEANSPALSSFSLHNHEGRLGFLRELFMRGYPALFEGVSHLWKHLKEPKSQRCFGIGLAAGTGGRGKAALVKFLNNMIDEGLETFSAVPPIDDYSVLDEWHQSVMQSNVDDEAKLCVVLEKYACLLVAHPFHQAAPDEKGILLTGPWAGCANRDIVDAQ